MGWVVIEAANAELAMAVCRDGARVHILITDIHLNDTANGWDVAEAFRAASDKIPVVYTSGNTGDQSRRVADSVFLDKPYRPHEVLEACQQLLASTG